MKKEFEGFIDKKGIEAELLEKINFDSLPRHVAIIMDGNGRWANARNKPRIEGHKAGIRAVRETVETMARLGIEVITLYAFSTENWKRPKSEIKTLMTLMRTYLKKEYKLLQDNNIRLCPIGRIGDLDINVQKELKRVEELTADNSGMVFNIALSYSGRAELTEAFRSILKGIERGNESNINSDNLTEKTIENALYTKGLPDPDLLIRTSGEYRISNFLLWQIAYAELCIFDTLWPDFRTRHVLEAIVDFQSRHRRYGKV